jgi:DNA topoisomerase-1
MTKQALVIVESPTKAKTIRKYLPKNYTVEACMGHVRDLPQSAKDIPEKYKKEDWSRLGVNVENSFSPLYVTPKGKGKVIKELKAKLKDADELYLATDEDREGESISWHLLEVLKPKIPVKRMVFHEITKSAIQKALEDTRDVDDRLVRAQETRRILDRLVGYTLSPLLWKKIAYGLSAGRVQSAGLRLIVERERARLRFVKAEYYGIQAELISPEDKKNSFEARMTALKGTRLATGKDFDPDTGKLLPEKNSVVLKEKDAMECVEKLKKKSWSVRSVEEKTQTLRPLTPFITSTLQQEANRKLGLSARDTMRTAQRLYEEGYITYMRTDSPNLSKEAVLGARNSIEKLYGKNFLAEKPRQFSTKSSSAQEAHEAIRPAGYEFAHPREAKLNGREGQLYELIWKRTVASQMKEAEKILMTVKIDAGDAEFTANGSRISFPGFLRAYVEGKDDPEEALEDREVILPQMKQGETLECKGLDPQRHETKPPARYTEASIVQALEKEGVGRPSTYASIIGTIIERGYVTKAGNALIPSFTGFAVSQLLEQHFKDLVNLKFTSEMENALDQIAEGKVDWLPYLKEFYLGKSGLKKQVDQKEESIDPAESRTINLEHIRDIDVKIGRYGPYLEKGEERISIPQDIPPADLNKEKADELMEMQEKGPESLGKHPETGEDVYVLIGRYGPYVQLGEQQKDGPKPKRMSVPKHLDPKALSFENAVKLLELPKELGKHPETGKPVKKSIGRFGPYIVHDGDFRSLKKEDDILTTDFKRAMELLAQEKKGRRGSSLVKELGKHPDEEKKIDLYKGKYGPYLKFGSKNIGLPEGEDEKSITLEKAVEIINAQKKSKKKTKKKATKKKTKKAASKSKKKSSKKSSKSKSAKKKTGS